VLDGQILGSPEDIKRHFGNKTSSAIKKFHKCGRKSISPLAYYESGYDEPCWRHVSKQKRQRDMASSKCSHCDNDCLRRSCRVVEYENIGGQITNQDQFLNLLASDVRSGLANWHARKAACWCEPAAAHLAVPSFVSLLRHSSF
jgi:hypothetical protein